MTQVTAWRAHDGKLFELEADMHIYNKTQALNGFLKDLAMSFSVNAPMQDDWQCRAASSEEEFLALLVTHITDPADRNTLKAAITMADDLELAKIMRDNEVEKKRQEREKLTTFDVPAKSKNKTKTKTKTETKPKDSESLENKVKAKKKKGKKTVKVEVVSSKVKK